MKDKFHMDEKKRTIGLLGAMSIGIGGMVGGGIFAVLGEAVSFAHGATPIAFLLAGIVALLTAYSYAKLSTTYQNRGGTVVFIDTAFEHNLFSGSINFMLWLSYLVTIAMYAIAFASYAQTFFSGNTAPWLKHLLISIAIVLPAIINLVSAAFVSKSETVIVVIKLLLLVLIVVAGASSVDTQRLSTKQWGDSLSILVSGMIIFVAYEGFELIANAAEKIENPKTNIPRAFYGSVLLVILLYVLISFITVGAVPEKQLLLSKDFALAVASKPSMGQTGFVIVAITALLATFSAINATLFGNARLGYILAKDGELPEELEEEERGIPFIGIWATTGLSLILANLVDLTEIAIIGSAGFLLIFAIVNLSALKMHAEIKGNRWVLLLALLTSAAALFVLLFHTYSSNPRAIAFFACFICFAMAFEFLYGRFVREHWFQRPY